DELWRYTTSPVECTDSPPAILDLDGNGDGDGKLEVVYGTFKGNLHVIGADGKRKRAFRAATPFIQTGPLVTDLTGDGVKDFVCAAFKGDNILRAVDGKSEKPIWEYEVPGKHAGMYHGPSIGDLDGDGKRELVIGAYEGKIHCLDAASGKVRWVADPEDRFFMSPTVIADLTGDGKPEVICASNRVTVIDRKGKIRWSKPLGRSAFDSALRGVSVADLDGDGAPDVAALTASGLFRVFRGKDGKLLFEFDATTLSSKSVGSSHHGVTIADLTGDGRLDVFFVVGSSKKEEKHGLAVCLTGFEGKGRGWTMHRHDPENTGNAATPLPEVLRKRVEGLTPARTPVMKPERAPRTKPVGAEPPARGAPAKKKVDVAKLHALAIQRGIPPAVLDDVIAANVLRPTAEARAKAAKHGRSAFRAACLLIEAGYGATFTDRILASTYEPGLEKELLALADGPDLPGWGKSAALRNLALADTPEIREYLLRRLVTERDPGCFYSAAVALGRLRESRAVPTIARQLLAFEDRWSGVEPHLVSALAGAGGKKANEWLVKYLADPRARRVASAVRAIARTDRELAAREARRLLESDRELSAVDRKSLEGFLK
ncbi:MAG: FG-GAP-like repeat-containing protein, partial [Planctomycetota bacterium]